MKRLSLLLLLLPAILCAANAGFHSDATTKTEQVPWQGNIIGIPGSWQSSWGLIIDSLVVDSAATAARDKDTCLLIELLDISDWEYASFWVNAPTLHDSAYVIATLLDTCRVVFQTAWHPSGPWVDIDSNSVDTVLSATTVLAQVPQIKRSDCSKMKLMPRYARVWIWYNLAIGANPPSGYYPNTYRFGYYLWNDDK